MQMNCVRCRQGPHWATVAQFDHPNLRIISAIAGEVIWPRGEAAAVILLSGCDISL